MENRPPAWVLGDEVYGNNRALRLWLEAQQHPFLLAQLSFHRQPPDPQSVIVHSHWRCAHQATARATAPATLDLEL